MEYHSTVGLGSPRTKQVRFPGAFFQVQAVDAISGSNAGLSVRKCRYQESLNIFSTGNSFHQYWRSTCSFAKHVKTIISCQLLIILWLYSVQTNVFFKILMKIVSQKGFPFLNWLSKAKTLRWYGTLPCCDALFIKINNNIKCNFIISFFPKFVPQQGSAVG